MKKLIPIAAILIYSCNTTKIIADETTQKNKKRYTVIKIYNQEIKNKVDSFFNNLK